MTKILATTLLLSASAFAGNVSTKTIDLCIKAYRDSEKEAASAKCNDMAAVLNGASNNKDLRFDQAFCVPDNTGFKASENCGIYDVVLKATVKVKVVKEEDEKF